MDESRKRKIKKDKLVLELFVSGMSPKSMEAIVNVKIFCKKYLMKDYELDIIDIYSNPELAESKHIVFCPSLIKKFPEPRKILIGTLSDFKKIFKVLGIPEKRND